MSKEPALVVVNVPELHAALKSSGIEPDMPMYQMASMAIEEAEALVAHLRDAIAGHKKSDISKPAHMDLKERARRLCKVIDGLDCDADFY